MQVTLVQLNRTYPNLEEVKPDKALLDFLKSGMEKGIYPRNSYLAICMLKYILTQDKEIKEYKTEFETCKWIYQRLLK